MASITATGMNSSRNSGMVEAMVSNGRRMTVIHLAWKAWKIITHSRDMMATPAQ